MAMKFYTKEQFTAYAKQQIIENNDLVKAWEITKESIKKFDNKVINKRLKDHINGALKSVFKYTFFTFDGHNFTYDFIICARDNDTYPAESGESVNYVNYHSYIYTNIGEDKRIDAEGITDRIDGAIEYLLEENKILEKEIRNIDDIEAEFNKIKSITRQFDNDKSRYIKGLYSFN